MISDRVAHFVGRIEACNAIIADQNAEKVRIFAEAREHGINRKVLKQIVHLRAQQTG